MGAFGKFERGIENAVNSVFSRAFKSEVKPVEIASALNRAMDEGAAVYSRSRTISPNEFGVLLSVDDFAKIDQWGKEAIEEELIDHAVTYATSQGYTFLGPLRISFESDEEAGTGTVRVTSQTVRGAVAPVTNSVPSPANPIIDVQGQRYLLTGPVTIIGRGSDADVVVDDTGVSRHHLELRVTPRGVIATDLGSTNGSFVEGHRISAATLVDGNTVTIGRTRIMFWTSPENYA
ncbi:FhaA domain-containing protein [Flaviflexus equikiangi]|uniref:DUF3662 domain-containing protein n=1 Tax=Flaviflexus equikiangi TaxID=2758573 RepID=A0ABS2TC52_9ACTO|nr:DUF3662 and FHA domain-containing protein [Flaviflexus equikiangi]MBM9432225.1 DUF3662 domain-containing protein [Flaviflexus equikiangi]